MHYLDHNATSPLRPESLSAVTHALGVGGNPSSVHAKGRAARAVMEHSRHVFLPGAGADQFARAQGLTQVDPSYFHTPEREQMLRDWRRDQHAQLDPTHMYGTVGAVALDEDGHLAAATSTGGLTGKEWGRIGDSPVIGAGTYARDSD